MSRDTDYPNSSTEYEATVLKGEHDFLHDIYTFTVCWKANEVMDGETIRTVEQVTAKVEYTVEDGTAELTGFYPDDTTATGKDLYRETLKAIRCIPAAYQRMQDLVGDDVAVERDKALLRELVRGSTSAE